ncbi:MAG: RNA polymerase sigma factor [Cellulosilyticum sp.]|nr:RNA polymerase sigma factor [Cellulosilyticum sp.]
MKDYLVQDEKNLIVAASKGDLQAFEKLICMHEKKIYNICLRLLKEPDEAYDATQEVCIKVWRNLAHFKGDAKLATWIYRIATNTCLDLLRQRKKRQEEIPIYENEETHSEQGSICWEDLSTHMSEKEAISVLWQGIKELPTDYRTIIVLRDIEGYAYDEIAKYLEISIGTVKSRLSRARIKLKHILEQNKEPYCSFFVKIKDKE